MIPSEIKRNLRWFTVSRYYCYALSAISFLGTAGLVFNSSVFSSDAPLTVQTKTGLFVLFGIMAIGFFLGARACSRAVAKLRAQLVAISGDGAPS
jgi:hypothetical protein